MVLVALRSNLKHRFHRFAAGHDRSEHHAMAYIQTYTAHQFAATYLCAKREVYFCSHSPGLLWCGSFAIRLIRCRPAGFALTDLLFLRLRPCATWSQPEIKQTRVDTKEPLGSRRCEWIHHLNGRTPVNPWVCNTPIVSMMV
jgi:hypothetical protein